MLTHNEVKTQVQTLVEGYFETGNVQLAGEAFDLIMKTEWRQKAYRTADLLHADLSEAHSLYGEKFMHALKKYDPEKGTPFLHFANRAVTNATNTVGKSESKRVQREVHPSGNPQSDGEDVDEALFFGEDKGADPYEHVGELSPEQKEDNQRKIVSDIMAQASEFEIEALMALVEHGSLRKAGDALGTNQVRIMRTIDRLQRYYDSEKYGDIRQYFTVLTSTSRKGGARA